MSTPGVAQRRAVAAHGVDAALVEREAALDDRREVGAGDARQLDVRVDRRRSRARRRRWRPSPASRAARCARCASRRPPARASGSTTPITSTPSVVCSIRSRSAGSAAAVAELQATTSSFAPRASSSSAIWSEKRSSSARRALAVGEARGVAEVEEVLVRQAHEQLVQDGQAADAGVEDADRAVAGVGGRRARGHAPVMAGAAPRRPTRAAHDLGPSCRRPPSIVSLMLVR